MPINQHALVNQNTHLLRILNWKLFLSSFQFYEDTWAPLESRTQCSMNNSSLSQGSVLLALCNTSHKVLQKFLFYQTANPITFFSDKHIPPHLF